MEQKLNEVADQILKHYENPNWFKISDVIEWAKVHGFSIAAQDIESHFYSQLATVLRRKIKRKKAPDDNLWPEYGSIERADKKTGKRERVYMREKFMKPVHYQQLLWYWDKNEKYAHQQKLRAAGRCDRRYGTQLMLTYLPGETYDAPTIKRRRKLA